MKVEKLWSWPSPDFLHITKQAMETAVFVFTQLKWFCRSTQLTQNLSARKRSLQHLHWTERNHKAMTPAPHHIGRSPSWPGPRMLPRNSCSQPTSHSCQLLLTPKHLLTKHLSKMNTRAPLNTLTSPYKCIQVWNSSSLLLHMQPHPSRTYDETSSQGTVMIIGLKLQRCTKTYLEFKNSASAACNQHIKAQGIVWPEIRTAKTLLGRNAPEHVTPETPHLKPKLVNFHSLEHVVERCTCNTPGRKSRRRFLTDRKGTEPCDLAWGGQAMQLLCLTPWKSAQVFQTITGILRRITSTAPTAPGVVNGWVDGVCVYVPHIRSVSVWEAAHKVRRI